MGTWRAKKLGPVGAGVASASGDRKIAATTKWGNCCHQRKQADFHTTSGNKEAYTMMLAVVDYLAFSPVTRRYRKLAISKKKREERSPNRR